MITRRSWIVYGVLFAIWIVLIGWQAAEHARVKASAETALRHRADDISSTMALIVRASARGGPGPAPAGSFFTTTRMENLLNDLVNQGEVISIKLLNADGVVVVSAGAPFELPTGNLPGSEIWDEKAQTLTLINPVELPPNIILPPRTNAPPTPGATDSAGCVFPQPPGDFPPPGPPPPSDPAFAGTNSALGTNGMPPDLGRRGVAGYLRVSPSLNGMPSSKRMARGVL